jgi:hypothetical protein
MAAIRAGQNEVAEYLIDQLAIDVQYAADLHEFRLRSRNPVRHRRLSCRDLAYNQGMMELVDLIDITNDDVTPNIKRYLINRLQTRLNIIHQTYLKRLEERNKHLVFESKKEKENEELPTVNITDENIITSSSSLMLPPITPRSYKSYIEETIQNIDTTKDKSIDETGKKTFRFSNYTLRFRLIETPDTNNKNKEQSQIPSLPTISLFTSHSTSSITTNNIHHTNSQASSPTSIRGARVSVCRSARQTTLPQIVPIKNKPPMIPNTKRFLPKRVNQNNIKYSYIPQQKHALYNQPQRFMPMTLKSTAIGLPSVTRIIRD